MTGKLVRVWNKEFSESVNGFVSDWDGSGTFQCGSSNPICKALRGNLWDQITVAGEPVHKHWRVMSWKFYAGVLEVTCEPFSDVLQRFLLPDWKVAVNTTGKWKVFREKLPAFAKPMWVLWDEHGEYLFSTGKEALQFANEELNRRYWSGVVDDRRKCFE